MKIRNLTLDNVFKYAFKKLFIPMVTHPTLPNTSVAAVNLEIIKYLDIKESGISDNLPYVKLANGLIFFGNLPNKNERLSYTRNKSNLSINLKEDCIRVAFDIAQRFCMENGYFKNLPRSYYMTEGGVVLDIGAYIGYGAIRSAKTVGSRGQVIAVEMDKENYSLMERNIYENKLKNITLINAAVGSYNGEIEYFDGENQNNSIHNNVSGHKNRNQTHKINCITLDTIVKNNDIDIGKVPIFTSLEINGAEPDALIGAQFLLKNSFNLQMRIAAPYVREGKPIRDDILKILKNYDNINVFDSPPQIIVSKFLELS